MKKVEAIIKPFKLDEVREALLSYCRMDTLAMVKVYQWLKTLG